MAKKQSQECLTMSSLHLCRIHLHSWVLLPLKAVPDMFSSLELFQDVRLLSLFRFKVWWMIPRVGNSGSDIPIETQMLLLEARKGQDLDKSNDSCLLYHILCLCLMVNFEAACRGTHQMNLSSVLKVGLRIDLLCVLIGDPAIVTSESMRAVFVNYGNHPFDLNEGINEVVYPREALQQSFLIIDDGWQDTTNEFQKEGEPFIDGSQYVYVWHALLGYWGGLVPNARDTKKYNPKLNLPTAIARELGKYEGSSYGLHGEDVDGVKVDVQNILETIATDLGGRVSLTRHFQEALEKSIASNFQDNSIICCMGLSTDSIYPCSSKRSAITRASDDYYPKNPATQTLHIAAVAFNSIFLGEVVVPDWDMFYSLHEAAEFHAIARAVGGCPVYVSDKPGEHDHKILKRLVLPDGSVLRAIYPGRPSRDCLFIDPVMDGKSLLKIWNLNKCTGVIGVFNCQGAGSWPCLDNTNQNHVSNSAEVSGQVSPADVEYFEEVSGKLWTGDCAIYSFNKGSVSRLPKEEKFGVGLRTLECDVFTVSPIKVYYQRIEFAPIGLMNMYNSGGAIESVEQCGDPSSYNGRIHIKGRGAGCFGGYSSVKPKGCSINGEEEEMKYGEEDKLVTVTIDASNNSGWDMDIWY
ncbi:hypothetical protein NC651_034645 [Populus alba x Populus x berolinensis]|nr:hypothetical protein NC651_034645 [Populus alba x Populus x berolinensis]